MSIKLERTLIESQISFFNNLPAPEYGEWSCGQQDADMESLEYELNELRWCLRMVYKPRTPEEDTNYRYITNKLMDSYVDKLKEEHYRV